MTVCMPLTSRQADQLLSREAPLILDLRDQLSFYCGHLPGAIHAGEQDYRLLLNHLNRDVPVLLYCDDGCHSREMSATFSEFGFQFCYWLLQGYEEWAMSRIRQSQLHPGLCQWMESNGFQCDDLEARGFNGETALMFAARQGMTEHLIDLIDHGADVNALNDDGNTALWLACYANDRHSVQTLIGSGATIDIQNVNGATALIYSASAGRIGMVELLLKAGADCSLATLDGFSALDVASNLKILRMIRQVVVSNSGNGDQRHHTLMAS